MKDYYGKMKQGNHPNKPPQILSAANSKEGVEQQARRFKNGPHGLQELAKRRRRHSTKQTRENSTPRNGTHNPAFMIAPSLSPPHFLVTQVEGGEDDPFTLSGNCTSQSPTCLGGVREAQVDEPAVHSREHLIAPDPLTYISASVDPFDALPLSNCPRTHILIYHGQ